MGSEISRIIVTPVVEAWIAFNRFCLDECTSSCRSPCCECGIETHHSPESDPEENVTQEESGARE